jgi:hypothetical protein
LAAAQSRFKFEWSNPEFKSVRRTVHRRRERTSDVRALSGSAAGFKYDRWVIMSCADAKTVSSSARARKISSLEACLFENKLEKKKELDSLSCSFYAEDLWNPGDESRGRVPDTMGHSCALSELRNVG